MKMKFSKKYDYERLSMDLVLVIAFVALFTGGSLCPKEILPWEIIGMLVIGLFYSLYKSENKVKP